MDNRVALGRTPVGRRLIALMTIFNNHDTARLRQYVLESFKAVTLDDQLAVFEQIFAQTGKLRVHQIVVSDEHRVVILTQSQSDDAFYVCEMAVESDYPHKITEFSHRPLNT